MPIAGPCTFPAPGHTVVEVKNCTCLSSHLDAFGRRYADLSLLQEVTCNQQQAAIARAELALNDRQLLCTGTDPNLSNFTVGVGGIANKNDSLFFLDPLAPAFKRAMELDRAALVAFGKGKGSRLTYFYVVYGYTNGSNAPAQAAATCWIFQAIIDDIQRRPDGAIFIVGDFNANLRDIPSIVHLLDDLQWTDVGAIASQ